MIPQRNISILSNRLARAGGRRIPEVVLERDYCLAWFLIGLSRTRLCKQLVFKGGTALKRCYFGDYRFSEDLDFSLAEEIPLDSILTGLEDVYNEVRRVSGVVFRYSRADRMKHLNSHTFYLAYEGPLPAVSLKEVKVDITINERFVCPISTCTILQGYDEYADLPGDHSLSVYSLGEICVEKIVALTDRARNEPRDLYDFWYLTSEKHIDLDMLIPEIYSKLEFRGRDPGTIGADFENKEARYRKLWSVRLNTQMAVLPPFDEIFRSVRRTMRSAGLLGSRPK
ncbi:MAG: nucleotidyl transferase AbiEii/AbiGii toxin family protein [Acidobacteria bacterium]|nr:nucleotidyl transferase AbiEii/AbiGii toxin family protein [Acidobacteriota bacterium]MCG2810698.1 nucleotidyl transferase AbiEii/AbiGii toxin family protein [Candidatus Aminicenantes bacterium]